jgi:hypothetical protein
MRGRVALLAAFALGVVNAGSIEVQAAENAAGWYALGTKASMAGFVPPPGTYFIDVNYYYSGDAKRTAARRVALRDIGGTNVSGIIALDTKIKVAVQK